MAKVIQFILNKKYYLLVISIYNLNLLVKIEVKNKIFKLKIRRSIK